MKSILITGGIGDFIALESFFSNNINKIYLATRAYKDIIELAKPFYETEVIWTDFSKFPCFFRKDECLFVVDQLPKSWNEVEDWSIMARFPTDTYHQLITKELTALEKLEHAKRFINANKLPEYRGSTFIKNKLCDISVQLPEKYFVIFPYTDSPGTPKDRNFNESDWKFTNNYLKSMNMDGIVLGKKYMDISVLEAIEITKMAQGYIGIDSFLSVIASKLFKHPNLFVKSINPHCYRYKEIYFKPQNSFEFLMDKLD